MKPYLKLPYKCTVMDDLLRIIEEEDQFQMYRAWMTRIVPDEIIKKDPFMSFLRFDLDSRLGIMRAEPWNAYKWHVDKNRKSTINMLISGRGQCFFSSTLNLRGPIQPLVYDIGSYYLFNTQEPHEVLNTDNTYRYMLTTDIQGEHKEATIGKLLEVINEQYVG